MFAHISLFDIAASLLDEHSQFELVVNSVHFGDGEMQFGRLIDDGSPWFAEDDWLFGYFCPAHFDDVFEVVFADADDFGECAEGVGLVHDNYESKHIYGVV
jgi:hypothetical protein